MAGFELPTWPGELRAIEEQARGRKWAEKALEAECALVAGALNGRRNEALNEAALKLGHKVAAGYLDRATVERRLFEAAAGYVATDGPDAARATIASGLEAGMLQPEHPSDRPMAGRPQTRQMQAPHPRPKFVLIRADQLEFREPEWLLEGLIEAETLSQLFGDPGCGKSFVALDMACCVSTGRRFHGRDVQPGGVIYLAGEGHNGIKRRLVAWEKHNGHSLDGAPLYVSKVAAQFLDAGSAEAVAAAVDGIVAEVGSVSLIIIDTLARNYGPGDENSTQDMSKFVAAVDALKARHGSAVLIVHHTGHADKQRSRGSMAMFGALDHEFRVDKDQDAMTVTSTKVKDSAPPAPLAFTLDEVDLGLVDRQGQPVTSAALSKAEPPARQRKKLSASLQRALDSFEAARRAVKPLDKGAFVEVEDWRPIYYERSTADTAEAKKKAFQRDRTALVNADILVVSEDKYRRAEFISTPLETCGTSGTERDMSRPVPGQAGHVPKACPACPAEMSDEIKQAGHAVGEREVVAPRGVPEDEEIEI